MGASGLDAAMGLGRRLALLAVLGIALAAGRPARAEVPRDELVVRILDVGQGSCVFIECPDGPPILDDCGKIGGGGDPHAAARTIRGRLAELGQAYPVPLQVLISHPHVDHYSVIVAGYGVPPEQVRALYWGGPWTSFSAAARAWIGRLAKRLDGAVPDTSCARGAHVACLAADEHALQTPRLTCGKAQVDLLTANAFSYDRGRGAAGTGAAGSSPNGESAVLRLRYAGVSLVFPGDAEQVTQLYAAANAAALGAPLTRTSLLLLPHHGSAEYGSNDAAWAAATSPQVVVVSANLGGNYGHPNCGALAVFDAAGGAGEMTRTQAPFAVRCGRSKADAHEQQTLRHQFVFTETNHDVTVRVSAAGVLTLACATPGPSCAAAAPP